MWQLLPILLLLTPWIMASRQVESRYITTSMYIRKNGEQGVRKRVVHMQHNWVKWLRKKNQFDFMQLPFDKIVMKYSYWYCDDKKLKKKRFWKGSPIKICTANTVKSRHSYALGLIPRVLLRAVTTNFWQATSDACRHCHRCFLFCKIHARPRPWGPC